MQSEGYQYVDVRTQAEFESGHPAGAYNVPVALAAPGGMTPNPDFVEVMKKAFAADSKLVIGCQSGGRSQRAVAALEGAGFHNMVEQRAGWGGARDAFGRVNEAGWQAEGLPAASGPDAERGYKALQAKK